MGIIIALGFLLISACSGSTPQNPTETVSAQPETELAPSLTAESTAVQTPTVISEPTTVEPTSAPPTPTPTVELSPSPEITQEPINTATPEITPTESPTNQVSEGPSDDETGESCTDIAAFYRDLSIPDETFFYQDTPFTKSWRLRNNGTCTWGTGYAVVFKSGDPLSAPLSNPLPASIHPGETIDISLDMQAPNSGGKYFSRWELQNTSGKRFGVGINGADSFWAIINVGFLAAEENPPPLVEIPSETEISSSNVQSTSGSCTYTENDAYVQTAIDLINQARGSNGLQPLTANMALNAAAQKHSIDSACNDLRWHVGSDGSMWQDRISQQGYNYSVALENVYIGDPAFGGDAQGAVNWWLNSPDHYANIMNREVTEIGVGFALTENAKYRGRFTAVFAAP